MNFYDILKTSNKKGKQIGCFTKEKGDENYGRKTNGCKVQKR